MAKTPPDTACPSPEAAPAPAPASLSVTLPPDMEGWLSTEAAAERLGLTIRRFRDYAAQHRLEKRKVDIRVYYAPEVIEQAAQARAAQKEAESSPQAARAAGTGRFMPMPPPPVDKTELFRQALAVAQAQMVVSQASTALLDRIVQNIGRMG